MNTKRITLGLIVVGLLAAAATAAKVVADVNVATLIGYGLVLGLLRLVALDYTPRKTTAVR